MDQSHATRFVDDGATDTVPPDSPLAAQAGAPLAFDGPVVPDAGPALGSAAAQRPQLTDRGREMDRDATEFTGLIRAYAGVLEFLGAEDGGLGSASRGDANGGLLGHSFLLFRQLASCLLSPSETLFVAGVPLDEAEATTVARRLTQEFALDSSPPRLRSQSRSPFPLRRGAAVRPLRRGAGVRLLRRGAGARLLHRRGVGVFLTVRAEALAVQPTLQAVHVRSLQGLELASDAWVVGFAWVQNGQNHRK